MPTFRLATPADAALITQQRHTMFDDNSLATGEAYRVMDEAFEPWVSTRLTDGRYIGLFFEEEGAVIAAAGIFLGDFPPHFLDPEPVRAYLLNFYTAPQARGRGFAKDLLKRAVDICHERNIGVVTLHASKFGKPIYEKFGFKHSNEMMLKLNIDPHA